MPERSLVYSFIGRFDSLNAGLKTASRNTQELGTKLTALDKNGAKMRSGLNQLGGAAGKVGVLAAAGLGAVIGVTARFDTAMSSVQAATHETADNMELLRAAALKAGADTAYSASESAAAIEELAKAGVSTADILDGGLSGALNLAAAGAIDVTDAAETAATAMTQFKLAGDQVNHVADLLAAGAGKAQGGVGDLGMALKQSGLVAAQTGLSIEETVGALSEFAANGLIGSDAGTSFKTMLQSLNPNSQKAADLMAELGISAYDAQGEFVGMADYAGQLQAALSGLSVEQQNAALKTIFGSDAVRAASIIFKDGADGVQEWQEKVNDAGYAAQTAGDRLDNLAGDWEQFTGSLETALIGAGEGSQGPLRKLMQGATSAVNVFNDMPGSIQGTTTALLGVTAVLGGGLWFGSKVVQGVADTKQALSDLGLEAGRTKRSIANIGAAAVGITAVIGAADLLQVTFNKLSDTKIETGSLTRDLEALADDRITDNLDNLFHTFQDVQNGWQADWNPLSWISSWDPSGAEQAEKSIKAIDESLAGLVESGSAETAAAAFENMIPTAEKAGLSVEKLKDLFPEYATALDNAASAQEDAAAATDDYGVAARKAQREAAALRDEMRKSREDARGVAESFLGLGDSLDDSETSLRDWIKELQGQANALRDFRVNAQEAADKGLRQGLIDALEEAGPAGAMRMKQLAGATKDQIAQANKAWESNRSEMRRWVDFKVPPKDVTVDTGQAMGALRGLQSELGRIVSKTITITVNRVGAALNGIGFADGGHTGHLPERQVAGVVHGDEFVTRASSRRSLEAARPGALDYMNVTGRWPGYYSGGVVGDLPGYTDGGRVRSLDERLEIAQLLQQIRDMRHDLAATVKKGDHKGEHELRGIARKVARLQLEAAQRDLRRAKHAEERELRQGIRSALSGFDLGAGMGPTVEQSLSQLYAAQTRDAFSELRSQVRAAGGELPKNFDKLRDHAVKLAEQLGVATQKYEDASEELSKLTGSAADMKAAVAGIFNNDIFAKGGLANTMLQLQADANDTRERDRLLQAIGASGGIDTASDAFKALATSADMQTLRDLDTLAEIKAYYAAYADRYTAQQAAGAYASEAAFGAAIAQQQAVMTQQQAHIDQLLAALETTQTKIATGVETASGLGAYAGSKAGSREGVAAGMADRQRRSNSKARTR